MLVCINFFPGFLNLDVYDLELLIYYNIALLLAPPLLRASASKPQILDYYPMLERQVETATIIYYR